MHDKCDIRPKHPETSRSSLKKIKLLPLLNDVNTHIFIILIQFPSIFYTRLIRRSGAYSSGHRVNSIYLFNIYLCSD